MKNNFHHLNEIVAVIPPQSVSNATVNGTAIDHPWERARLLTFLLLGGAFGASASGRARVQVQQKSDDAWVNLKESDGATDLEFDATALDDAGAAENGSLIGTLDLNRIDSEVYKAVRLAFEAEHASATQLVAVVGVLNDRREWPSGEEDNLFYKHTPYTKA